MEMKIRFHKRLSSSKRLVENVAKGDVEWELRPGGMLVQKRNVGNASSGAMIKIKVSHGSYHHVITVPAQSKFGDLKRVLAEETGLEPKEQRLLFQGKERDDEECLHMVGVIDMSKVVLLEDPASKERKLEEMQKNQSILKAYEEVAKVRAEVDKLSEKVIALEEIVRGGATVSQQEFVVLVELLMVQLLQLDTVAGGGEAEVQRKIEVSRVQGLVDTVDNLKARNSDPFSSSCNAMSVGAKWDALESGVGSPTTPTHLTTSTRITHDWEVFD